MWRITILILVDFGCLTTCVAVGLDLYQSLSLQNFTSAKGPGAWYGRTRKSPSTTSRAPLGGNSKGHIVMFRNSPTSSIGALRKSIGYGPKLIHQETAGFSLWFQLPGPHFGVTLFLTHSHIFSWRATFCQDDRRVHLAAASLCRGGRECREG